MEKMLLLNSCYFYIDLNFLNEEIKRKRQDALNKSNESWAANREELFKSYCSMYYRKTDCYMCNIPNQAQYCCKTCNPGVFLCEHHITSTHKWTIPHEICKLNTNQYLEPCKYFN